MYKEFQEFWDKKWKNVGVIDNNPLSLKVEKYFSKKGGNLIDVGSGNGRDSVFFSKKGFTVNSFDFSLVALNNFKEYSHKNNLVVNTVYGNTLEYDFGENNYDIVYACNSLHYFSKENTKIVFEKLKNTLKSGGYFFLRVKSIHDIAFGKGEKIEENFYKNGEDLKYYFDINFIKELFSDFEIKELEELQDLHNILQGDTTINGFIDLVAKK